MDHSALKYGSRSMGAETPESASAPADDAPDGAKLRRAPRVTMLIRSAKLITKQGEFVCVVRDASRTGVRIRLFHSLPDEAQMALQMPSGNCYELRFVRQNGSEAGFEFVEEVDVDQLISEVSEYPKRALRFNLYFPIFADAGTERWEGVVENISQQGARFQCDGLFAIDQSVRLVGGEGAEKFPEIQAKVRWRRDSCYGVVFDDTFSLEDFAKHCVALQSPMLSAG